MNKKFLRQWTMLRHIPRFPTKTTTRHLKEILGKNGFEITQRTIQRDLKSLSSILPGLQVDNEKDFPGWYWSKEAKLQDIPTMDNNIALTFQLVDHFLKNIFPPSVLNQLKSYFDCANHVLEAVDNSDYSHWPEKVRILPRTQPLIPARIDEKVIAIIYEGLFKGQQVRARYTTRFGDEVGYDLHPLGLIFRESVIYLVATIWNYQDPRHLALHRFKHCELLDEKVVITKDFNLDDYLAGGSFEYCKTENKTIRLKIIFFDRTGHHLIETPLSADQKILELGDGQLQVEATVKDSEQLRWWLLGFGDYVKVVEPENLRGKFEEIAKNLLDLYQAP